MARNTTILKRQNVEQRLCECALYPVTFVCAPLGYGKTTAVRAHVEAEGATALWVSGVPAHEETLWQRLCQTCGHHFPAWAEAFGALCYPLADVQRASFISLLSRALDGPCVLVLDDYHALAADSPFQHLLYALALEQLPLLRILCLGRHMPRSLVAELRAKELCGIIGPETLALSRDEVAATLSLRRAAEPARIDSLAEAVHSASEGWAAAVFLMIEGVLLGEDVRPLESTYYLFERVVFEHLDPESRQLLVKLALFEDFSLAEAAFVLESPDVQPLVERLNEHNTFITHNVSTNTYRLHALFRNFLRHKADCFAFDAQHLLYRRGLWHLDRGNIPAAFQYHYKAGRLEELFSRLTCEDRLRLPFECCETFHTLVREQAEAFILRHPFVFLYLGVLLVLSGHRTFIQTGKRTLQLLRRRFATAKGLPHPQRDRLLHELRIASTLARFNNPYLMFKAPPAEQDSLMAEICRPAAAIATTTMGLPSLLFCYYRHPGELDSLAEFMIANIKPEHQGGIAYGFEKLLRAEIHLERLEMEEARQFAEQAIAKATLKHQYYIAACAHFVLMRLAVFMGNIPAAFERLDIIRFKVPEENPMARLSGLDRFYATFAELCESYLLCLLKNTGRLTARLARGKGFGKVFMCRALGLVELGTIKVKILGGQFAEAEVLCDYYEREFAMYHNQLGLLRCKLFRSIILRNLRQHDAALQLLRETLEEAATDRIMLIFAENADFILPLLRELQPAGKLSPAFLETVRQACRQYSQHLKSHDGSSGVDLLTTRELDVFRQLTKGQSQKSMALELGISVSTVKRHLESIYTKFGVNNRVAALNKGVSLGL